MFIVSLGLQAVTFFPLALPLIIFYFIPKWFVDKYNLMYVCKPMATSPRLLEVTSNCALFSIGNAWVGAAYIAGRVGGTYSTVTAISVFIVEVTALLIVLMRSCCRCSCISRLPFSGPSIEEQSLHSAINAEDGASSADSYFQFEEYASSSEIGIGEGDGQQQQQNIQSGESITVLYEATAQKLAAQYCMPVDLGGWGSLDQHTSSNSHYAQNSTTSDYTAVMPTPVAESKNGMPPELLEQKASSPSVQAGIGLMGWSPQD